MVTIGLNPGAIRSGPFCMVNSRYYSGSHNVTRSDHGAGVGCAKHAAQLLGGRKQAYLIMRMLRI